MRPGAPALVLAASVAAALFACGCGAALDVTSVRTGPALAARPPEAKIPIFFNQQPGAPYREVGQIRVRSKGDLAHVLDAAAAEGRRLGADALIVDVRAHYASVEVMVDCDGRPYVAPSDRLNARAVAIVYTGPAAGPEPAPAGPPPRSTCAR